jgi:sporulation protein YlmC with PRC-barrel domain
MQAEGLRDLLQPCVVRLVQSEPRPCRQPMRRAFSVVEIQGVGFVRAPTASRSAPILLIPLTKGTNMETNYVTRDNFGMYANSASGPGPALMGANTLLGNDVYNRDGEDLGDIKEFMIDMVSGKVAYAVLSFGGMLGMGDKLFAVPWAALVLDTKNKRFTLNVLKDALKDAPGFDKDRWPVMSDRTWASGVHKFYGTPYASQ